MSCEFTGRPRPQIVWDKDNNTIANKAVITEQETQKNDVLITTSTLSIPGRPEFRGFYTCSATSRLDSGWLSTKNDSIEVVFYCKSYVYIIDQARVLFLRFVSVHKNAKRERGQYPAILTELAWSIKDLLYGIKSTEKNDLRTCLFSSTEKETI